MIADTHSAPGHEPLALAFAFLVHGVEMRGPFWGEGTAPPVPA